MPLLVLVAVIGVPARRSFSFRNSGTAVDEGSRCVRWPLRLPRAASLGVDDDAMTVTEDVVEPLLAHAAARGRPAMHLSAISSSQCSPASYRPRRLF